MKVGSPDEVSMPGLPRAASGGVGEGGAGSDGGAPGDKKNGKENGKGKIAKAMGKNENLSPKKDESSNKDLLPSLCQATSL